MNMINFRNTVGDVVNAFAGYAAFFGMLSEILACVAALMSIIWFGIRFYEYFKNKRNIDGD